MLTMSKEIVIPPDFSFLSFYQKHQHDFGLGEDDRWIDAWLLDLDFPLDPIDHSRVKLEVCQLHGKVEMGAIYSLVESLGGILPGLVGAALAYTQAKKEIAEHVGEATIISLPAVCPMGLGVPITAVLSVYRHGFWKLRWCPCGDVWGNPYVLYYKPL